MEFELPNETSENVHLEGKFMYFLSNDCTGKSHNVGKDSCGKVEIMVGSWHYKQIFYLRFFRSFRNLRSLF